MFIDDSLSECNLFDIASHICVSPTNSCNMECTNSKGCTIPWIKSGSLPIEPPRGGRNVCFEPALEVSSYWHYQTLLSSAYFTFTISSSFCNCCCDICADNTCQLSEEVVMDGHIDLLTDCRKRNLIVL